MTATSKEEERQKPFVPLSADPRILALLEEWKAAQEAQRHFLESLQFKKEITKGEIVQLFQAEREEVRGIVLHLQSDLECLELEAAEDAKRPQTAKDFCHSMPALLRTQREGLQKILEHVHRIGEGIQKL